MLASAPVASRVKAAWVDRQARKGTGPSDHAPVIVDLDEAPDGDIGPVVPPPCALPGGDRSSFRNHRDRMGRERGDSRPRLVPGRPPGTAVSAQSPAAAASARPVSTRARCRR